MHEIKIYSSSQKKLIVVIVVVETLIKLAKLKVYNNEESAKQTTRT